MKAPNSNLAKESIVSVLPDIKSVEREVLQKRQPSVPHKSAPQLKTPPSLTVVHFWSDMRFSGNLFRFFWSIKTKGDEWQGALAKGPSGQRKSNDSLRWDEI
jgi:hypothetical protein